MTPGARVAAAIEVLDQINGGQAAEQALLRWARASRFAGSKDRAAVRDHVFTVLRQKRSAAAYGGGESGRNLMIGALRLAGTTPETLFTGEGHAPAPLSAEEQASKPDPLPSDTLDVPDWLMPELLRSLGGDVDAILDALRHRAPVDLRVNGLRCTRAEAQSRLDDEGISVEPLQRCPTALRVLDGARKVSSSAAFQEGWVDLQDLSSQEACLRVPLETGNRVLDYCAGGGGKSLALAGRGVSGAQFIAHDVDPRRMADLPTRASRAGAQIKVTRSDQLSPESFDVVVADVPCSGSGTWRRQPDAKWRLDLARLQELVAMQRTILDQASDYVCPDGALVYMTCALLRRENEDQIAAFQERRSGWVVESMDRWSPLSGGDGFFAAVLRRTSGAPHTT